MPPSPPCSTTQSAIAADPVGDLASSQPMDSVNPLPLTTPPSASSTSSLLRPTQVTAPTPNHRNSSSYTSLASLPHQQQQDSDDDTAHSSFSVSEFSNVSTPLMSPVHMTRGRTASSGFLIPPQSSVGGGSSGEVSTLASSIRSARPPTPLPWLKTLTISSVLFCNSFNTTVLLPFIAFMVEDFGIAPSPEDVGKYSGFMLASYMTGQMIFSYPWGIAADVWGRKPSLLIGLLGSCICTILFGFSPNFGTALFLRFLCGSLNGIVSITKTTLSEITDQTNQGKAFGVLGVARAVGLVVGPAVGGLLSQVDEKYPETFPPGSLFARFPYAIPCLIGGIISGIGFVASVFILEETRKWPTSEANDNTSSTSNISSMLGFSKPTLPPRASEDSGPSNERTPLLLVEGGSRDEDLEVASREEKKRKGPMTAWELMTDNKISLTIVMYALISGLFIQYDEVFSLWAKEPLHRGGLNFSTSDLGIVFSIGGVFLFVYQLFVYPPLELWLGALKTFRWGVILSIPVFLALPNVGIFGGAVPPPWGDDDERGKAFFGDHVGEAFTSAFIMTANACPSHSRGSANGVAQAFGAFGRMVGPVLAGNLFSWSIENGLSAPFDFHLLFYLLALISAGIYVGSLYVPADVDFRLDDEEEDE
ncbi:hypothetical protein HDU67_007373 [Dinochytrium kinnereticum]|nr:hypothetical protein HDU67_007373 [Dinochytrium kinnereticum]